MNRRIRTAIRWAIGQAVRVAALLVPKRPGLWVIGGNRGVRYADNSMHFHRYCVAEGLDVVWLTRSQKILEEVRAQGHRAHLIASPAGLWFGLRATWHAFDVGPGDTGPTSRQARRMNLWHGIPLKDTSFLKANRVQKAPDPADHFAHPNRRYMGDILASFQLLESNIVIADLPRNRVFSAGYDAAAEARDNDRPWVARLKAARESGLKVVGYFPTWRGGGKDLFLGATSTDELRRLDAFLISSGLLLATKWHTCSFKEYRHPGASKSTERIDAELAGSAGIVSMPFDLDLNSILPECDMVVTDYSSVLFDFALCDRPQVFVPYDLEEYEASVGFFHDYATLVPGRIARNIPALIAEMEAFRQAPGAYRELHAGGRAALRAAFFEVDESSPRIAAYMAAVESGVARRRGQTAER